MKKFFADESPKTLLLNPRFIVFTVVGILIITLVSALAPSKAQVIALGAFISMVAGLNAAYLDKQLDRERRQLQVFEELRIPINLAPHSRIFEQYTQLSESISNLASQTDPFLIDYSVSRLGALNAEVSALSNGRIEFP